MKHLLLALVLSGTSTVALAHPGCLKIGELASNVLELRYAGEPKQAQIERMEGNIIGIQIVNEAYEMPQMDTEFGQMRAMAHFRVRHENRCRDVLGNLK